MSSMNPYLSQFQELEVIGRGNFGSATLVKEYGSGQVYIAKKIILAGLKEKEQESSKQEAELLKSLSHPNIVAYKDSFMIDGTLIIIMEFCEEGDLAFHIKRKKNKKEKLPEAVILNWFTQIAAALGYIHQHKILHRDIKTSNIFVNSNGDIKIGDFGISRVLENTHDSAQTVVGTPYYMSPEVCESKPYTQKSDVWALGCVVYELCTFEHAFNSNNLLGLVYKIVKEKVMDIPNVYSQDLKNIVNKMLEKDDAARPTIAQILQQPFLQKAALEYLESNGKNVMQSDIPVKMTYTLNAQLNGAQASQDPELGETFQSMAQSNNNQNNFNNNNSQTNFTIGNTCMSISPGQQQNYNNTLGSTVMSTNNQTNAGNTLTAKQLSEQKKKQKVEANIQALNQATRDNAQTLNIAKARKQEDYFHHTSNGNSNNKTYSAYQQQRQQVDQFNQNQILNAQQIQQFNSQQNNYINNNNNNPSYNAMGDLTNQMGGLNISQATDQYSYQPLYVSNYQQQQMYNVPQQQYGQQFTNNPSYPQQFNNNNDQFNNTEFKKYQDQEFEEYNSDDEDKIDKKEQTFTLTGTYSNRLTLKASDSQKEGVLKVYKDILIQKPKQAGLEDILEQSGESGLMTPQKTTKQPILPASTQQSKIEKLKQECLQALPEPLFTKAYDFIKSHKMNPQTQKELNEIIGKQNASKCLKIEELIYKESEQ